MADQAAKQASQPAMLVSVVVIVFVAVVAVLAFTIRIVVVIVVLVTEPVHCIPLTEDRSEPPPAPVEAATPSAIERGIAVVSSLQAPWAVSLGR